MEFFKEKILEINKKEIFKISFTNDNNYSVTFFNLGGYIHSINIPYYRETNKLEDVVLGYSTLQDYIDDKSYFNCIVGRVCGRISNSQFSLNNKTYQLFSNDNYNHLHGGISGFNKKIWSIKNLNKNLDTLICDLNYLSPHMEEGYPGNLNCTTQYTLNNNNEFTIRFNATTDADTIINLTNHNYWNFHGHDKFYKKNSDHKVKIFSSSFCELDKNLIPTGKIIRTKNTKYDFCGLKDINEDMLINQGIDTCYVIDNYDGTLKKVAIIYSNLTKMGVELSSNQPGLQFYTGNMMEKEYRGKNSKTYGYQHAICLEPQHFPNAINNLNFKSIVLKPDQNYKSTILMKLKNNFNE